MLYNISRVSFGYIFYSLIFDYQTSEGGAKMAVPKRKVSKARRDKRRSQVWKLSAPAFSRCPQCGEYKMPHRVCGNCGYYKGKEVIAQKAEA